MAALLGVVILFGGLGVDASSHPDVKERQVRAGEMYQRGRVLFESGKMLEAIPFFEKASEWAPEFPEPYLAKAQSLNRLGRADEAQLFLNKAQRRLPPAPTKSEELVQAAKTAAASLLSPSGTAAAALQTSPAVQSAVPHGLVRVAELMHESGQLISAMAASSNEQACVISLEQVSAQWVASAHHITHWLRCSRINITQGFTNMIS